MATRNFDVEYVEEDSDEEAGSSSEDEIDAVLKRASHVQHHGKGLAQRGCDSSEDDFEKLMNAELDGIVKEKSAGNSQLKLDVPCCVASIPSADSSEKLPVMYYDSIYFDSDSEGEYEQDTSAVDDIKCLKMSAVAPGSLEECIVNAGRSSRRKRHAVPSNDELMYDPNMDAEDQEWVDQRRKLYQVKPKAGAVQKSKNKAASTDAVLNCPACMVTLCLDCQRHSVYQNQYRAMFVMNCVVDATEKLSLATKVRSAARHKLNSRKRKQMEAASAGSEVPPGRQSSSSANGNEETYFAVRCKRCSTHVAMFDTEEVYHFFNIIASHA